MDLDAGLMAKFHLSGEGAWPLPGQSCIQAFALKIIYPLPGKFPHSCLFSMFPLG